MPRTKKDKFYMYEFGGPYGWFACFRNRLAYKDFSHIQIDLSEVMEYHHKYTQRLSPITLADNLIKKLERVSK